MVKRTLWVAVVSVGLLAGAAHGRAGGGQTYSRPATSYQPPVSRPAYTPSHPDPPSTPYQPSAPYHPASAPDLPPSPTDELTTPATPGYSPISVPSYTMDDFQPRDHQRLLGVLIFLTVLVIFAALLLRRRGNPRDLRAQAEREWTEAQRALAALRRDDANFSEPVFVDFVLLVYTRLLDARGRRAFEALAAFVGHEEIERQRKASLGRNLTAVDEVVVGGITIDRASGFDPPKEFIRVVVEVTANYTEHSAAQAKRWFVMDRLSFIRRRGVLSKTPEGMRSLACPSCGAPSETRADGTCPYCDRAVGTGEYQWVLEKCQRIDETELPKTAVTDVAPEVGTDLDDVFAPDFEPASQAFHARHPDFDDAAFERKVADCFMRVQSAWSSGRWDESRAVVSDALYNRSRYWMDLYAAQGLANRLDDVKVERVSVVRYDQDAYYDAITVRIHAAMRDYFVDAQGRVVGGDSKRPRRFSEYWTFLRRSDFDAAHAPHASGCPNCGAPLEINASGECAHCASKINSGRFDWVLTKIEQDEDYTPA